MQNSNCTVIFRTSFNLAFHHNVYELEVLKSVLFGREARYDVEEIHITSSYRLCILQQILFQ